MSGLDPRAATIEPPVSRQCPQRRDVLIGLAPKHTTGRKEWAVQRRQAHPMGDQRSGADGTAGARPPPRPDTVHVGYALLWPKEPCSNGPSLNRRPWPGRLVPVLSRALRDGDRAESRAHRREPPSEPHARHRAQSAHRLRQRRDRRAPPRPGGCLSGGPRHGPPLPPDARQRPG